MVILWICCYYNGNIPYFIFLKYSLEFLKNRNTFFPKAMVILSRKTGVLLFSYLLVSKHYVWKFDLGYILQY